MRDDRLVEGDEQFFVNLFNPSNATIGDGRGVVTIKDNDPPLPSITINDVTVSDDSLELDGTIKGLLLSDDDCRV